MPDDALLNLLRQGVEVWNDWREEHKGDTRPNLSGADLNGRNLSGANLEGANLEKAKLQGAFFRGAELLA